MLPNPTAEPMAARRKVERADQFACFTIFIALIIFCG
jgi:hypothetical protein